MTGALAPAAVASVTPPNQPIDPSRPSSFGIIRFDERNEFIRGPRWRTRVSPGRRARAASVTFALVVASGVAVMGVLMWLLSVVGAPTWLVLLPWLVPTLGMIVWALARPQPAVATDDDDEAWVAFAIQFVIVGEDEPRSAPVRVVAAALFGAPVVWSLAVFGLSILVGLF